MGKECSRSKATINKYILIGKPEEKRQKRRWDTIVTCTTIVR